MVIVIVIAVVEIYQLFLGNFDNIDTCKLEARRRGLKYIGIQYGNNRAKAECWGGNNPGSYGKANNCNMKIQNGTSWGGTWANQIYRSGLAVDDSVLHYGDIIRLNNGWNNIRDRSVRPDPLKEPKYLDIDGGTMNGRDHITYTSKQPYSGTQWQVYDQNLVYVILEDLL